MRPPLKYLLPATGRASRSLSTATSALSTGPSPYAFDATPPRLLKNGPTTAITTYSATPGSSSSSSSQPLGVAHPRSTNGYPGTGPALPLIWLIPGPSSSSKNTLIERQLPWNPVEGSSKDAQRYTLDMAAYGIPKRRRPEDLPPPSPTSASYHLSVQVGEDAYFLRPDALGVADGVGGWKHKGGESNSALFAKKLMHFCSTELAAASPSSDPVQILQNSYERCVKEAKEEGLVGSSTATLALLADSELRIAHVGDCVVCVVRDGEMVFRSDEMQHSFNYPYQLGPRSTTTPSKDAVKMVVPVRANDIVILASDGMGDNLWDEDVLDEVNRFIRPSSSPPPTSTSTLSFSGTSSSSSSSNPPPGLGAYAPAGSTTNTVLAQRLSEALASRAKRVSERRAISADASGTMGAFAQRGGVVTQTPTPPPSPRVIPGMELPKARSLSEEDFEEMVHLGDGHGADGEYGGSGAGEGPRPTYQDTEEEWVSDEIPFGRKAREAGVRFVGGKGDDISVLVAIISGSEERVEGERT